MSTPRLQIDLDKIFHNAATLTARLKAIGVSVTAVTKGFLGAPQIAQTMLSAGITSLGDSRIENIERMRRSGIDAQMVLIRAPLISQADRVIAAADISLNTELKTLTALSVAASRACKTHGVLLMVELGDLREGIMPPDIGSIVQSVRKLPSIRFMGLGSNLACRSGVSPDNRNMAELSNLASRFTTSECSTLLTVSGGNSSNLDWIFAGGEIGGINNLRLGEAILFGREPLRRTPISGLHTNAISLIAEVIESKSKPSKPWGTLAQSAFNDAPVQYDQGDINQVIVAIGRQDVDHDGLTPPDGINILDASSDHLVLDAGERKLSVGSSISFQLNYSAFLRAMTSPYVGQRLIGEGVKALPYQGVTVLPHAA